MGDSFFFGEFKTQEQELKALGREETSGPKDHLGKSTKNSETKESVQEEAWLFTMWLAVYLFQTAVFEADASLKRMPLTIKA